MRLIFFICLCFANMAKAAPVVNENFKFYPVTVYSAEQLLPELNNASPIREDGMVYHGHSFTNVKWNFWWHQSHGQCRITRVATQVDITYTMPKLMSENHQHRLLSIWNSWYPSLLKHERGHAGLAIDMAQRIEQTIRMLPPSNSCETLENTANKSGRMLLELLNQRHREYDDRTRHGETEGASLLSYL